MPATTSMPVHDALSFTVYTMLLLLVTMLVERVECIFPAKSEQAWQPATATWYGSPDGAGTDGGACGYGSLPNTPYGSDVGAGSPVLFRSGIGCGTCYEVKCEGQLCSRDPVNIVITDECPGGYCSGGRTHFDLSGTAFGKMAADSGKVSQLLASGVLNVIFRRAECIYRSEKGLVFQVADGATPYWFSVIIRYVDGPGELASVHLRQAGSAAWQPMSQVWGANWCLNAGPLRAPFSIRLTALETGQTIVARNVIPANWSPERSYIAHVNFNV